MKPIRKTAIIRQRGQLTIPEAIRRASTWAVELCIVSISLDPTGSIVIRPEKRHADWKTIQKEMEMIRSFHGSGSQKESLSAFIARDRMHRR